MRTRSTAARSTAATGTREKKRLSSKKKNSGSLKTQGGSSRQVPETLSNPSTQLLPQPASQASMLSPSLLSIPLEAQSVNEAPLELDYDGEGGEDIEKLPQPAQPASRTQKREGLHGKKTNSASIRTQGNLGKSSFAGLVKVLANLNTHPQPILVPPQPPSSPSIPLAAQSINQILAELDSDGEEAENNETPLQPARRALKKKRPLGKKSNTASLRTQDGSSRQVPATTHNLSTQPQPTHVLLQPVQPPIKVRKASTQPPSSPSILLAAQSINQPPQELDYDGEGDEDNETPLQHAQPARPTLKKKQIFSKKINSTSVMTHDGSSRQVPATISNLSAKPWPTLVPPQPLPHPAIKVRKANTQPPSLTSTPLEAKFINQPPPVVYYDCEEGDNNETPLQPAPPSKRTLKQKQICGKINSASLRTQGGSSGQVPATISNLSSQPQPTLVPPQPLQRPATKVRKASTMPPSSTSIPLAAMPINQPPPMLDYDGVEGVDNETPLQPSPSAKRSLKRQRFCCKKTNSTFPRTHNVSSRQVAATLINLGTQSQPTVVPSLPLPRPAILRKAITQPLSSLSMSLAGQSVDQPSPELEYGEEGEDNVTSLQPAQPTNRTPKRKRLCSKKPNTASLRTQGGSSRQVPATLSNLSTQPQPNTASRRTQGGSSKQVPATVSNLNTQLQPTLVPPQPVRLPTIKVRKASTQPPSSPSTPLAAQSLNQHPIELDYDDEEGVDNELDHDGEEGEDNELDHGGEEEDNELDHVGEEGEDNELDHEDEEDEDNELDYDEEGEKNELDYNGEEGEDNETPMQRVQPEENEVDYYGEEGEENELDYDGEDGEDNGTPMQLVQPARRRGSWFVDVLDEHGTRKVKQLTVRDVWSLPSGEKVVVTWNSQGQPIEDGGGLLNRFLGSIARDFVRFPINYSNWKKVPYDFKDNAYRDTIHAKFDIDSDVHKSYVFKSIGSKWRDNRQELWQRRQNVSRNRDQLIAMAPEGMDRNQWTWFVDYRLNPKTLETAQKNKNNRKKQTMPHTCGSKSLARRRAEMELECGRQVSRGEVWTATHKHADGTFVTDQARQIGEKIQTYESSTVSVPQDISTKDSLAHALGSQEHCGRVRGLGLGPCPSQVFGRYHREYGGMTSASASSYKELQDEITALRLQVNEQNKKFDALMTLFTMNYKSQLSSDISRNL